MRSGAKQSPTLNNPYIKITISTPTPEYYYNEGANSGVNERVVSLWEEELIWGGQYIVNLDNSDGFFDSKDYKGYPLYINHGFIGESGSTIGKLWVHNQQLVSREGSLQVQLDCIDIFGFLATMTGGEYGASWNEPWQSSAALAEKDTLPSGAPIPDDLITKISSHYGKSIKQIADGVIADAFGGSLSITWTDLAEDSYLQNEQPIISSVSPRNLLLQALEGSISYLRWESTGVLRQVTPEAHGVADTLTSGLYHFSTVKEDITVLPNRVCVWYIDYVTDPDVPTWEFKQAIDSESYARLGNLYIDKHFNTEFALLEEHDATTAQSKANALMDKIKLSKVTGQVVAPMHCAVELFDAITIIDDRYGTPKSITGYVFGILREYNRGVYRITLQFGGVSGGHTPDGGEAINITKIPTIMPNFSWDFVLPQVIQGFDLEDVDFSAVDWDTVQWTGGYVHFYDGTSKEISAGNTGNLALAYRYYIWFDLEDSEPLTLHVGTEAQYLSAFDKDVGLICIVQRGVSSGIMPWIVPTRGKQPLITCDIIRMDSLKAFDWGDGTSIVSIHSTDIEAGHIKLSSVYQTTGYRTVSDTEKTTWGDKNKVWRQATAPTVGITTGDLWFDTANDNKPYRYNGATWDLCRDSEVTQLRTDIESGKITLTYETVKDGNWYQESGVLISATYGLRIYGEGLDFSTYKNVSDALNGTDPQCYMGTNGELMCADGVIRMDDDGLWIWKNLDDASYLGFLTSSGSLRAEMGLWTGGDLYILTQYDFCVSSLVHIAFTCVANVSFNFGGQFYCWGLPTSNPGYSGALYRDGSGDGATIKISGSA